MKFKGDEQGNFFFTQSVASAWNVLPGMMVEADMIVVVKRCLHRHMDMQGTEGYGFSTGR